MFPLFSLTCHVAISLFPCRRHISSNHFRYTHLFLESSRHQTTQLRQTVVDPVSPSLLDDLEE